MVEPKPRGREVVEPHLKLTPLLKRHGLTWEGFRKAGRPAKGVPEQRRAIVRDLQVAGHSWAEMIEITGTSQGFIQRNRDPDVPLRPEAVFLTCAWCGTGFHTRPAKHRSKVERGQSEFYCSRTCAGNGHSASRAVELACGHCETVFTRKKGVVDNRLRHNSEATFYCSRTCASSGSIRSYRVQDAALFDYLAGVVCGDGSVHLVESGGGGGSRVSIAVGFKDVGYVDVLTGVVEQVFGFQPTVQKNRKARAMCVNLCGVEAAKLFAPIKKSEGWELDGIRHPEEFLAGFCDTDGGWPKKRGRDTRRSFNITQKTNGNLERTLPLWSALGMAPGIRHYTSKKTGYRRSILRVFAKDIDRFKASVPLRHPKKAVMAL